MTREDLDNAAGEATRGAGPAAPAHPQPRRSIFDLRAVAPLGPEEQRVKEDAMARALVYGAAPVRDQRGWALEVDFIEANGEAVEPWKHDREHKRLYRRSQKLAKAAGQLIGQPGDREEWGKRLARQFYREGSDPEGAVRRGLFEAIWRFDHVYDSFTVPRRYGPHYIKTGRIAAVAEEARRKWQAEGLAPADVFWVRNRRNTGLVLVTPNPDTKAPAAPVLEDLPPAETPVQDILSGQGAETVTGQADIEEAFEPYFPEGADRVPAEHLGTDFGTKQPVRLSYPDLPLASDVVASKTRLADGSLAPVINLEKDRIANILADEPAVFEIADSATASGEEPIHAFHGHGYWAVWVHQDAIEHEAKRQGVDPDLVKAIAYVENAQGASYGRFFETFGVAGTILPMNINPDIWGKLGDGSKEFEDPLVNVRAGVTLIRRLQERVEDQTVAKVASPYKFTGMENVSDYGARVAEVYKERLWEQPSPATTPRVRRAMQRRRDKMKKRIP